MVCRSKSLASRQNGSRVSVRARSEPRAVEGLIPLPLSNATSRKPDHSVESGGVSFNARKEPSTRLSKLLCRFPGGVSGATPTGRTHWTGNSVCTLEAFDSPLTPFDPRSRLFDSRLRPFWRGWRRPSPHVCVPFPSSNPATPSVLRDAFRAGARNEKSGPRQSLEGCFATGS